MFVTKKTLPRRTFLRAMGTTIALPFLDAMVPALSARAFKPTPRFGFVYIANGVIQNLWTPATTGAGFELTPTLSPFANLRDKITVLSGLSHLQADTFGDGTGDHPRASAVWLTGVHAYDRTRPDVEVKLATTVDQLLVRAIGKTSRIPSIEMSVDFPTQGSCDSGDCFYVNTVSWRNETTPNNTESHPRILFERLFGDGGSAEARQLRSQSEGSILDSVREEANRVANSLGRGDKAKLHEYLDSVREIEQRIQNSESQPVDIELPERPTDIPSSFDAHTKLMFDLQVLAFQADITRVFSMIMSRELSTMTFPSIGVPGAASRRVAPSQRPAADCEEGTHRSVSVSALRLLPREAAVDERGRRLRPRPVAAALRRRHGRRQHAPPRGSADVDGWRPRRHVQDGAPSPVQAGHADGQPAADDHGRRRPSPREDWRQQRQAARAAFNLLTSRFAFLASA